jgi:hypothetical protein
LFQLCKVPKTNTPRKNTKNIYITSDEEIKGTECWYLWGDKIYKNKKGDTLKSFCKKIILTTDQDLIKDGIQEIPDEFLKWFVKNPSCEEVEVEEIHYSDTDRYEIIIPKEEPKTNLEKLPFPKLVEEFANYYKKVPLVEEPKQETLEEAAETELYKTINKIIDGGKDLPKGTNVSRGQAVDYAFEIALKIAKWQQERSYSKKEVLKHLNHLIMMSSSELDKFTDEEEMVTIKWFDQFKKKL